MNSIAHSWSHHEYNSLLNLPIFPKNVYPQIIDLQNIVNLKRLPSDLTSEFNADIFISIVDFEFSMLSIDRRAGIVMQFAIAVNADSIGTYGANITWNGQVYTRIINLTSAIFNRNKIEAAVIVAKILKIDSEYCFKTFPVTKNKTHAAHTQRQPTIHIPQTLTIKGDMYTLSYTDCIHDFSGIAEQAICKYTNSDSNYIFLIANRIIENDIAILKIGRSNTPAYFYSRDAIGKTDYASVILCVDMLLASKFRSHAREAGLLERTNCIISGFFGGDNAIECLNFSELISHPVVIIPRDYTSSGLKDVVDIATRCKKSGVTDVKIYPWPIIALPESSFQFPIINTEWEKLLWEQVKFLDSCEVLSVFTDQILRLAMQITDYENWMRDIGLTNPQKNDGNQTIDNIFVSLDNLPNDQEMSSLPTWDDLICPDHTTLIWGPSNAGKSWVAIQLAVSIATCSSAFGIHTTSKRLVFYMDGEVGNRDFARRCSQIYRDNGIDKHWKKNLLLLQNTSGVNILDDASASRIITGLREGNVQVLIIDNLLSLAPLSTQNPAKLHSFIRQVKEAGIAVIIVHHSGKDGATPKGSSNLSSLSQNIIMLEGKEQLRELTDLSTELVAACDEDGPVVRMKFTKCKVAPRLENKQAAFHLPVDGTWNHVLGTLLPVSDEALLKLHDDDAYKATLNCSETTADMKNLHPDEEKVYAALLDKNHKRLDLEIKTGFKADKVLRLLKILIGKGLVKKNGNSKISYYSTVDFSGS